MDPASETALSSRNQRRQNIGKSVEHNYAPNVIPSTGVTTTTRLFMKRQKAIAETNKTKEELRAQLYAEYLARQQRRVVNAKKQHNRDQYLLRLAAKNSKYSSRVTVPKNLSPWLNFSYRDGLPEHRLAQFNKKHNCQHGNKFTSFNVHSHTRTNGDKEPAYLEPLCFCSSERIVSVTVKHHCGNCTNQNLNKVVDPTFPGDILSCRFCHYKWYRTIGWSRRRQHWLVATKVAPYRPPSTKTWNALPPQTIEAQEEFGVADILSPLKHFLNTCLDWVKRTATVVVATVVEDVVKTALQSIWDCVCELITNILAELGKRPSSFILTMWTLLTTESHFERALALSAIIFETSYVNLWNRLVHMLGLPGLMQGGTLQNIQHKLRHYTYEKQKADFERLRDDAKNNMDLATQQYASEMAAYFDGKESCRVTTKSPYLSAEEEDSGTSFLSALFGLRHILPKTKAGFDLMRDFNTAMSGWKNLHELVNQLIEYLPGWFTKVFTITDPVKRFGTEAKTKGTPVYNMIQAYLGMLQGENCASAEAYDTFTVMWKACDTYVNSEFAPSERVLRLMSHYRTSAQAIMRPGTYGSKPIPYVITMFGMPGQGKSATWPLVVSGIVGGTVQQIRAMSYTRNSTSAFFDGYCPEKHKIFCYDDFGSQVDDEAAGELMSIVSNADYLPPFGSMSDPSVGIKGTSFASPLVILCSNFKEFNQCKQIADKTALQRRLGIVINWHERLDMNNPNQRYQMFRTQTDGSQQPLQNHDGTNYFTLREMQEFLRDDYARHMTQQTDLDDEFNKFICKAPSKVDFRTQYEAVRQKGTQADEESGMKDFFYDIFYVSNTAAVVKCFGFYALITLTFKFADFIDERYKSFGDACLIVGTALGLAMAGMYLFFGKKQSASVEQSGENTTAKAAPKPFFVRATPQSGDLNDEAVVSKVLQNHVVLVDEQGKYNNALFLYGNIILTNKHFLKDKQQLDIHTHRATDTHVYEVKMSECRVEEIPNVDLALLLCPEHVMPARDIRKYICDEPITAECEAVVTRRKQDMSLIIYETFVLPGRVQIATNSADGSAYKTYCDIVYKFRHAKGDCGNVVFAKVGGNMKIIGLHAFGSTSDPNMSLAVLLNQHELREACHNLVGFSHFSKDDEFRHEGELVYEDGIGMNKQQFVAMSTKHIHCPTKTSLRPSTIHDKVRQHVTEPAKLKRSWGHDPFLNDLTKYALSTKQYPQWLVEEATNSLSEELMSLTTEEDQCRELTLHEALNGIPGLVESVDLTTSSGYPFSLYKTMRGAKRLVINGEPGELTLNEFAHDHFNHWDILIGMNIVPNDPYLITMKDERRKIEKVRNYQTRLFCAGSLTGFLHNKISFGMFCAFLKRVRGQCFSTLGLNRSSQEWHELIMRQLEVGEYALDGDQKQWDGRFKSGVAMGCLEIIRKWYRCPKDSWQYRRMHALFLQAVFPTMRMTWTDEHYENYQYTLLFEVAGCMPSGWYLTFVMNSLVNATLFRMAWYSLVSAPFNDLRYFRQYTRDKYAGDDNLVSVSTTFLAEFNNLALAQFFEQYEQKYTPSDKSGTMVAYKRLVDCQFLKLTTGRLYDRYVPLFDHDANLDTMNWIRKCDDPFAATESNCNDVLRNLFFYGKEVFTHWRDEMLRVEPRFKLVSYLPLEEAYLDYGSIPDPTGSFAYSKNYSGDPMAFYRAIQKSRAEKEKLYGAIQFAQD